MVGSYCINNSFTDVVIMFIFAILGVFFKVFNFPTGPLVLGLLLGGTLESNMRRALTLSVGDWSYFITRPISCVLFVAVLLTFLWPIGKAIWDKKKAANQN